MSVSASTIEPAYALDRFVAAQGNGVYENALAELRAGRKQAHWMWFVFPQIAGLGRSVTAVHYAIAGRDEAVAYLAHGVLGPRLLKCTDAMLLWAGKRSADEILGTIDAMKFSSSMTLFDAVSGRPGPYRAALEAFFDGVPDHATLERL